MRQHRFSKVYSNEHPDQKARRLMAPQRHPRNDRMLTIEQLRESVASGETDTVILAFTDMQGRLQGKFLHLTHKRK